MISALFRSALPSLRAAAGTARASRFPLHGIGGPAAGLLSGAAEAGGQLRTTSSLIRRRRRALHRAEADPHASTAKVRKLRERAVLPSYDLLRHIGENKLGKAQTYAERKSLWYEIRYKKYAPVFLGQVKPHMKFWTAALEEAQLPPARLPEVAVCGRSNSGKSTLVNYLCGRHSAHVKRTPGSTTEIVFWQIGKPASLCLVDLPGYGFAEAPEEKRLQWTEFTLWYARSRRNLKRVLLLISAQAGLKPTDREMIAFLERHGVAWQIVVTKCDKVKKRDLAKRLTLLQEEVTSYRKMAAPPIPVSSLKRRGMDSLREVLDSLKVRKEYIKDGIRRRIYDLLELRRIKRSESAKRRKEVKEAKRQQEADGAEAAGRTASVGPEDEAEFAAAAKVASGPTQADLHSVLADWGFDVGEVPGGAIANARGGAEGRETPGPKPLVLEAHYTLEDRDSMRVQSFVQNLFPDLPSANRVNAPSSAPFEQARSAAAGGSFLGGTAGNQAHLHGSSGGDWLGGGPVGGGHVGPGRSAVFSADGLGQHGGWRGGLSTERVEEVSDSDSDDEAVPFRRTSSVLRFDAGPARPASTMYAGAGGTDGGFGASNARPSAPFGSSPFPGLGSGPDRPPLRREEEVTGLRRGWVRPSMAEDTILDQDDFASEADRTGALRRWAPPAPSPENRGSLLAEARRRYEREWATELQDVEEVRNTPSDTLRAAGSPGGGRSPASAALAARAAAAAPAAFGAPPTASALAAAAASKAASSGGGRMSRKLLDMTGAKGRYITQAGNKPLLDGATLYRVLGRPPSRVLKSKYLGDASKVLKVSKKPVRKRNAGAGLEYEEAKDKWMNWYKKNKTQHFDTVVQAASPAREDVEAEWEYRMQRKRRMQSSPNGRDARSPGVAGAGRPRPRRADGMTDYEG